MTSRPKIARFFLGLGAAASLLAIPAIALAATPQQPQQPQAFGDLFSLAQHDYSMAALAQIFGGIIDFLRTGNAANLGQETLLTVPVTVLNLFAFGIAGAVGAYTLADYIISSATTGTPGGGISTPYTLLRFGAGVVLLLPVQGGFSIIHLVLFWIALQGAGLGDTAWKLYAEEVLAGRGAAGGSSTIPAETWPMRDDLANATYALTAGHLCRLHMDRLSDIYDATPSTMTLTAGATEVSGVAAVPIVGPWLANVLDIKPGVPAVADAFGLATPDPAVTQRLTMYFQSPATAGNSRAACPYLSYELAGYSAAKFQARANAGLQERLHLVAAHTVFNAAHSMLVNVISPRASALAARIYTGGPPAATTPSTTPPPAPLRDEAVLFAEVEAIVAAAEAAMVKGVASARSFSNTDIVNIRQGIIDDAVARGWALASLQLRALGEIYLARRALLEDIKVVAVGEHDIGRVYGRSGRALPTASSVDRASFAPVKRDFDFLRRVEPRLPLLASPFASSAEVDIGGAEDGALNQVVKEVVAALSATSGGYSDPFLAYMSLGSKFSLMGSGLLGGAATLATAHAAGGILKEAPGASAAAYVVEKVADAKANLGRTLLVAGFVFGTVVPFLPILYALAAFIGWLFTCVITALALPLVVLSWFSPGREHSLRGTLAPVVMPLFRILMMPVLVVTGLIICCLLLWLGGQVLALTFANALGYVAVSGGAGKLFTAVGSLICYVVSMILLALFVSRIIIELDDKVMALVAAGFGVGAGPSSASGMFDPVGVAAGGGVVGASGQAFSGLGRGMGGAAHAVRGAREQQADLAAQKQANIKKLAAEK